MPDTQFCRDASGRLSFEMCCVPGVTYGDICGAVAMAFHMTTCSDLVTDGVSIVFQDYRHADNALGLPEQVVELAWDNWTDFTVVAKTPASESLVRDIADWLLQTSWAAESR